VLLLCDGQPVLRGGKLKVAEFLNTLAWIRRISAFGQIKPGMDGEESPAGPGAASLLPDRPTIAVVAEDQQLRAWNQRTT